MPHLSRRALVGAGLGVAGAKLLERIPAPAVGRVLRVEAETAERVQAAVQLGQYAADAQDRGRRGR